MTQPDGELFQLAQRIQWLCLEMARTSVPEIGNTPFLLGKIHALASALVPLIAANDAAR